jgi:hypothetical protein
MIERVKVFALVLLFVVGLGLPYFEAAHLAWQVYDWYERQQGRDEAVESVTYNGATCGTCSVKMRWDETTNRLYSDVTCVDNDDPEGRCVVNVTPQLSLTGGSHGVYLSGDGAVVHNNVISGGTYKLQLKEEPSGEDNGGAH